MFDEKFLEAVRKREFYSFEDKVQYPHWDPNTVENLFKYNWQSVIDYINSHPLGFFTMNPRKYNFTATKMETRGSTPRFAKDILLNLGQTFPKNSTSVHMFGGLTSASRSFEIHKDKMDVLYVQILGKVKFSTWIPKDITEEEGPENISEEKCNLVYSDTFTRGRMYWIPRGRYHLIEPLESRIGFSFGVEGQPDPSTYV